MYSKLAQDLLFGHVMIAELGPKYGLQFRKGKDKDSIVHARSKALKNGHAKIEFELNMLEVYLKQVLKKA